MKIFYFLHTMAIIFLFQFLNYPTDVIAEDKVVVIPLVEAVTKDSPNVTIRSGNVFWDYRIGQTSTGSKTILIVSSGKNFILTDVVVTGPGTSCDCRILEGSTVKISVNGNTNSHFVAGIPFLPGSNIIVSQPYCGDILAGNIVFGVTISGYEY